jgi:hypothetical protein
MTNFNRSRSATPTASEAPFQPASAHDAAAQRRPVTGWKEAAQKSPDYTKWQNQVEKGPYTRLQKELKSLTDDPPPYCLYVAP